MPPRRRGEYIDIELSGPIFGDDPGQPFYRAMGEGIREMGDLGADILTQFVSQASFIDTGAFVGSVGSEFTQEKGSGFAVIRPTDVWPAAGRPPRIWYERGTRAGTKLRKAGGGFAKTRTRLRQTSLGPVFEARLQRALN